MQTSDSVAESRAHAAFVAAAAGDALGWPMEDRGGRVGGTAKVKPSLRLVGWRRREGGGYAPHQEAIEAGSYSDDTQLLLAVARSRMRGGDWLRHFVEAELPVWTLYERGGGGATKRAAQAWARGHSPWSKNEKPEAVAGYFEAGGNGVAMRSLVHPAFGAAQRPWAEVRAHLDDDAICTHGHPRALVGARLYAWAVWWALNRRERLGYGELIERVIAAERDWAEEPSFDGDWIAARDEFSPLWRQHWVQAVEESLRFLSIALDSVAHGALAIDSETLDQIGFFGRERGSGTITSVAAVFLAARYTSQPQQGLLAAAFTRNSDSDTLASMTGGLLGTLAGGDWLGELARDVQDAEYVRAIAEAVARGEHRAGQTIEWRMPMRTGFYRKLDMARPGDHVDVPLFGTARVDAIEDFPTNSTNVRGWALRTELGQTLWVKRYDRGRPDGMPRWIRLERTQRDHDARDEAASQPASPRAGLVREVSDLARSTRFYEEVVGLRPERASATFVSFGWLALELRPSERPAIGQLQLPETPDDLSASRQAIRVYVESHLLRERREKLINDGLTVSPIGETAGRPSFRCADPDGYVIEFCGRNGNGSK